MRPAIAELTADHEALAVRLDDLDALRGAEAAAEGDLDALARALEDEIGIHSRKEDEVLFPALARHGFSADLLRGLSADHAALRKALAAFERARAGAGDWRRPAGHITAMLRTHMRIENERVFPEAERMLAEEELAEVAAAFRGLDRPS